MESLEEALEILRSLRRKHGRVLSLSAVFDALARSGIYGSKQSMSECLHRLQGEKKIRPVNFGVDIELLEDEGENEEQDGEPAEYVQSSLDGGFGWLKRAAR
jgi:hypothetical protein